MIKNFFQVGIPKFFNSFFMSSQSWQILPENIFKRILVHQSDQQPKGCNLTCMIQQSRHYKRHTLNITNSWLEMSIGSQNT